MQGSGDTGSASFFEESAVTILRRLDGDASGIAADMRAEATRLAGVFRTWASVRPDQADRVREIEALFSLNRRVLEYGSRA